MRTFRNKHFTKRDYDCTNIVACVAAECPNENWIEDDKIDLGRLTMLYRQGDVFYYGYL